MTLLKYLKKIILTIKSMEFIPAKLKSISGLSYSLEFYIFDNSYNFKLIF